MTINVFPTGGNATLLTNCKTCLDSNVTTKSNPSSVTLTFKDPLPAGATVISASARVMGNWNKLYGSSNIVTLSLDDTDFRPRTIPALPFSNACSFCLGGLNWDSETYMFGWPNYVYGGLKTIKIRQSSFSPDYFYVGQITLTLAYV